MDRKNNVYASTDPLSKNKNIDNFVFSNRCHRLKSITQPNPLISLPYRKSLGVFTDMSFYIGLHGNSDIFFLKKFPRPILFSAISTISKFLSAFLSPSNFHTTFYLDSILFSPLPDIEKFLQALVSFLKDIEGVSQKYIRIEIDTAFRC